jgi:hypothetical protein
MLGEEQAEIKTSKSATAVVLSIGPRMNRFVPYKPDGNRLHGKHNCSRLALW